MWLIVKVLKFVVEETTKETMKSQPMEMDLELDPN